jgi:putative endonuclease
VWLPFRLRNGATRRTYVLLAQVLLRLHHDESFEDALHGRSDSLERRVREHKLGEGSEFAAKYKVDRLVYFERFDDIRRAIDREKQIKGLLRIKKIALIVSVNPAWKDLSEGWYDRHRYQPERA